MLNTNFIFCDLFFPSISRDLIILQLTPRHMRLWIFGQMAPYKLFYLLTCLHETVCCPDYTDCCSSLIATPKNRCAVTFIKYLTAYSKLNVDPIDLTIPCLRVYTEDRQLIQTHTVSLIFEPIYLQLVIACTSIHHTVDNI